MTAQTTHEFQAVEFVSQQAAQAEQVFQMLDLDATQLGYVGGGNLVNHL